MLKKKIKKAIMGRILAHLSNPYRLSFVNISYFDTVWIWILFEDDSCGIGEAVALPGYSHETADDIEEKIKWIISDINQLEERAYESLVSSPFASSAVLTALQMNDYLVEGSSVSINKAIHIDDPIPKDYQYIKIKLGPNIPTVFQEKEDTMCTFDANQAFTLPEALDIAKKIATLKTARWFEQPVSAQDWVAMETLCEESLVPIILDEAISSEKDVMRAKRVGAYGVKLKLCKVGGPKELENLVHISSPLKIIQGNGVATDISNLTEIMLARKLSNNILTPCEASGFAKLTQNVLFPLQIINGNVLTPSLKEIKEIIWNAPQILAAKST